MDAMSFNGISRLVKGHQLFNYAGLKGHPHKNWDTSKFKGTVRPDWICMRVVSLESPLMGHQPL